MAPPSRFAALYPPSRRTDTADTVFGTTVSDPYRWLEDGTSPESMQWMKAQDLLTRAKLAALPERESIAARLRELFYVDDVSPPWKRGGRFFNYKRSGTQEKSVVYWREGKDGVENVLLDPNSWTSDGSLTLGDVSVSWDGKLVAYQVSKNNADESTTHVMEIASGKKLEIDTIEGTQYGSASWTPTNDGFYYRFTPNDPKVPVPDRSAFAELRFHRLGDDPSGDLVAHEKTGDAKAMLSGWVSRDGRWLVAEISHGWVSNDIYYQDLLGAPGRWMPFVVGNDAQYSLLIHHDSFYVTTNEGAPRSRLFMVDGHASARANWEEIIPERLDSKLEGVQIVGGKLAVSYLKDVASHLELRHLDGTLMREIPLPTVGSAGISGERDEDTAYVAFTSFTHPHEVLELSVATGATKTWFASKVPVDRSRFVVEQVSFASKDGTRVPMFIVHARDLKKDGTAPLYLTGYGGFQISMTPAFASSIFPWLERGGVYAVPNLRGGGEFGEEWHRAGMLHAKQNVFDDFFAAAEYLVREGYTRPDKLVAYGGSNGGLLMGAAIAQRPDLFRVVLCDVPLLDMVRFPKFGLGEHWVEEYGSPDVEADFRALLAYSPYHHIAQGTKYPSVLMLSADSDDRVDPMHARKFAAELQARSSGGPVLVRIERNAGHGGADMLRAWVDKMADLHAFALAEIGEVGGSTARRV